MITKLINITFTLITADTTLMKTFSLLSPQLLRGRNFILINFVTAENRNFTTNNGDSIV